GTPRYIIYLKDVSSAQSNVDDFTFAKGFDDLAKKIKADTGVDIGFTLDPLAAADNGIPGNCTALPATTYVPLPSPMLEHTTSVVAIQPYRSEINVAAGPTPDFPHSNIYQRMAAYKRWHVDRWTQLRIPYILDLTSGYDGRLIFGGIAYGNND